MMADSYGLTAADHSTCKSPSLKNLSMELKEAWMQSFREATFLNDATIAVAGSLLAPVT